MTPELYRVRPTATGLQPTHNVDAFLFWKKLPITDFEPLPLRYQASALLAPAKVRPRAPPPTGPRLATARKPATATSCTGPLRNPNLRTPPVHSRQRRESAPRHQRAKPEAAAAVRINAAQRLVRPAKPHLQPSCAIVGRQKRRTDKQAERTKPDNKSGHGRRH